MSADGVAQFTTMVAERRCAVGVVGLGYVGLPLATGFGEAGFRVVGFDVDGERVANLNDGRSHIEDVSGSRVAALVDAGLLTATADPRDLARVDAVFISVPTPFDQREDARPLLRAGGRRVRRNGAPPGDARHPAVDDLSGHDERDRPARSWSAPACASAPTSTSPSPPSGSTPATPTGTCATRPRWSAG